MPPVIAVSNLVKTYASGFQALKGINLDIRRGEIFALLGPNGAGKTTLINIICGIVNATSGSVLVDGHHFTAEYRAARSLIGLVPQELTTDAFETVWATVTFSRRLFGKRDNPDYVTKVLKDVALWDRKDSKIMTLSGGMKRRVLIARPFPTSRRSCSLMSPPPALTSSCARTCGTSCARCGPPVSPIILTTHYIEEAEQMADRIGVINNGEIILVEEKAALMQKLGKKQLTLLLQQPLRAVPEALAAHNLMLAPGGTELIYTYDTRGERTGITALLQDLSQAGIRFKDLQTTQSSLQDIFVDLVRHSR